MRTSLPIVVAALLLAPGCLLTVDEVNQKISAETGQTDDTDADTGEPLGPLEVSSVAPTWSPGGGGTLVTISAGPLGDNPQVTLGGVAASVVSSSVDEVVVRTPGGLTGWVDVSVRSATRTGELAEALQYFPDESGKTALYGSFSWFTWGGPDVDYSEPDDFGAVWVRAIEPQRLSYADVILGAAIGDCVSDHDPDEGLLRPIDAPSITLSRSGGSAIELPFAGEKGRYEAKLTAANFVNGTSYSMSPLTNAAWPTVGVPGLVDVPDSFTVTSPNLDWRAAPPAFDQDGTITWSGGQPGDYVAIIIERYQGVFGPTLVEVVSCAAVDDGEFALPVDAWDGWNQGSPMRLYVGRIAESGAQVPHTGADTQVVGASWVLGSVTQGW